MTVTAAAMSPTAAPTKRTVLAVFPAKFISRISRVTVSNIFSAFILSLSA